jgi:hypothetical protein
MNKSTITLKFILILATGLALSASANALAAARYRVSTQFFHLGELIGKPVLEVEEGVTAAGEYSAEGWGHYTIALLVRPAADGQVFVSMQFTSGKLDIQPNLLADIGQPRSATIDKVRMNLLVEEIGEEQLQAPDFPLQSLTQNIGPSYPE